MDSVYEAIGGMETFERLVHGFYSQVKEDNVIGPMYPDNDWEGAEQRLPGSWPNTGAARSYFLKTAGTRACACATPLTPSI